MSERWLPLPGFDGRYEVSDHGLVKSLQRRSIQNRRLDERILKSAAYNKYGHRQVALYDAEGRRHSLQVHRLVLLCVVGPAPRGTQACHNDGDPSNNRRGNLRWDTPAANTADAYRHGRRTNPAKKLTADQARAIRVDRRSNTIVGAAFHVSPALVSAIRNGRAWSHA